jgi:carboxylesterase
VFVVVNTAPFFLEGDRDAAVLCVHGFTSTPFEVRYLAESLQRRGLTAAGLMLPGHGTSVAELDTTGWRDWFGAVEREYEGLTRRFSRVAVVGQSLGGLLSLYLAAQRAGRAGAPVAVASLAAPLWLEGLGRRLSEWTRPGRWLHGRLRQVPKVGGSDLADLAVKATYPSYKAIPMAALHQLCDFMRVVDEALPRVTAPTLVLHGRQDHTAPVAGAKRIGERMKVERTRLLDRSFHLISLDLERDVVAEEVGAFLLKHLTAPPP